LTTVSIIAAFVTLSKTNITEDSSLEVDSKATQQQIRDAYKK